MKRTQWNQTMKNFDNWICQHCGLWPHSETAGCQQYCTVHRARFMCCIKAFILLCMSVVRRCQRSVGHCWQRGDVSAKTLWNRQPQTCFLSTLQVSTPASFVLYPSNATADFDAAKMYCELYASAYWHCVNAFNARLITIWEKNCTILLLQ